MDSHQRMSRNCMDSNQIMRRNSMDSHQRMRRNSMDSNQRMRRNSMDSHQRMRRNSMDSNQIMIRNHGFSSENEQKLYGFSSENEKKLYRCCIQYLYILHNTHALTHIHYKISTQACFRYYMFYFPSYIYYNNRRHKISYISNLVFTTNLSRNQPCSLWIPDIETSKLLNWWQNGLKKQFDVCPGVQLHLLYRDIYTMFNKISQLMTSLNTKQNI